MAAKFAPVCPIHIYKFLDSLGPEFIGNYFLLLAHDVLENKEEYAAFFKERRCTIIMDNSVVELGSAVTPEVLLEAGEAVNATCIAIPDEYLKGRRTYELANEFFQTWTGMKREYNPELMFIPQGEDHSDFIKCADATLERHYNSIQWIGIARNTVGRIAKSRTDVYQQLKALCNIQRARKNTNHMPKFHLLGFSDDIGDDLFTCTSLRDEIAGIDSAVPLRITTQVESVKDVIDPGPRGDWWETVQIPQGEPCFIGHNTRQIRKLIGEVKDI